MIRYRIYTENKNFDAVVEHVASVIPGFSVFTGVGVWQGQREKCLVIEVMADDVVRNKVYDRVCGLATWIKNFNSQQAVIVAQETVESHTF